MSQKEELFNDKLKDIFIGEKIKGKSGYAKLMRIKSDYFDQVFQQLNEDINDRVSEFDDKEDFRRDLYDKLYTFLKKYFSDSGSIYFTYTPLNENIYEEVYDNNEDVTLFWKTHMLYYVKTDTIWDELEIESKEIDGVEYDIKFDVSSLEGKEANEKKDIKIFLEEVKDNNIEFSVKYHSHGMSKTAVNDIRKDLKKEGIKICNDQVRDIVKTFKKQNEVDFFLNKDAERFLKKQFDMWVKQYVLDDKSVFEEKGLKKIKAIRNTAYDIIDFVSQFEEELKKIWNKPKFALNSNYVITLDRLTEQEGGKEVLKKIQDHEGWEEQLKEWKDLGIIDDEPESIFRDKDDGKEILKEEYGKLPIDTKYFKDLEIDILSLFENLTNALDGKAIRSENYQALKTIGQKYKSEVKSIYIDPPYNTEKRKFPYKDNFKSSTWLSMMENRLSLAKDLLAEDGEVFISIDYHEMPHLRKLCNQVLGQENFRNTIVVRRGVKNVQAQFDKVENLTRGYEYVLFYSKNPETRVNNLFKKLDQEKPGSWNNHWRGTDRPTMRYPLFGKNPEKGQWRWSKERSKRAKENYKKLEEKFGAKGEKIPQEKIDSWYKANTESGEKIDLLRYNRKNDTVEHYVPPTDEEMLTDCWLDISPYGSNDIKSKFGENPYENPKPVKLVKRIVKFTTEDSDIFMDFFAGSGTTGEAVIRKNIEDGGSRKFLLVEMADYFKTLLLPRLKKTAFSTEWKGGQPGGEGYSIFFKYFELEQYEQALKKCTYENSDPFNFQKEKIYDEYVFLNDKKMLESLEIDEENEKIDVDLSEIYNDVDIAETLSNVKGKKIKKINDNSVEFVDGEVVQFDRIQFKDVKPLIWWN